MQHARIHRNLCWTHANVIWSLYRPILSVDITSSRDPNSSTDAAGMFLKPVTHSSKYLNCTEGKKSLCLQRKQELSRTATLKWVFRIALLISHDLAVTGRTSKTAEISRVTGVCLHCRCREQQRTKMGQRLPSLVRIRRKLPPSMTCQSHITSNPMRLSSSDLALANSAGVVHIPWPSARQNQPPCSVLAWSWRCWASCCCTVPWMSWAVVWSSSPSPVLPRMWEACGAPCRHCMDQMAVYTSTTRSFLINAPRTEVGTTFSRQSPVF